MGSNGTVPMVTHGKKQLPKLAGAGQPLCWQVLGQDLFQTTNQMT